MIWSHSPASAVDHWPGAASRTRFNDREGFMASVAQPCFRTLLGLPVPDEGPETDQMSTHGYEGEEQGEKEAGQASHDEELA